MTIEIGHNLADLLEMIITWVFVGFILWMCNR
jgi:hypothetical protein